MKEKLNIGAIGMGGRGYGLLTAIMLPREEINVLAVCDLYEDRRQKALRLCAKRRESNRSAPLIIAKFWP